MQRIAPLIAVVIGGLLLSTSALADRRSNGYSDDSYYVKAKVVHVEPIVRIVEVSTPERVCWNETVRHYGQPAGRRTHSYGPALLGGVVGGVLGNQFGDGRERRIMTVAGALLGASVGHGVAKHHRKHHYQSSARTYRTTERHCDIQKTVHEEERIDGYRVTYQYRGREFVTRTVHHPGRTLRVRVQVEPAAYNDSGEWGYDRHRHRVRCDDDCYDT